MMKVAHYAYTIHCEIIILNENMEQQIIHCANTNTYVGK